MTERRIPLDDLTSDQLDALYDEREQLLDELGGRDDEARERWIQKQLDETGLKAMDFRNGMAMEIQPARELVAQWVGAARAMLGDASNYTETPIEMEVKVGESPERFAFVLQRVGKLSPHQARQQAEQRAEQAEAAIERVRKLCDRYQTWHDGGWAPADAALVAREYRDALDQAQQPTTTDAPTHLAKGTNAEDCPACKGTNPDYPFLCPGPEQQPTT
ncbi:hypothetical protein [Streptomyces sp. NPDC048445]|uniref:hypothetical protein n=1 Tax=Streptomyces sp. NPDC048445 TaxID=3365553 RepID=UPI00370FDA69